MQDLPRTTENGKYSLMELRCYNKYRRHFCETVEQFKTWDAADDCQLDMIILSRGSNVPKIDGPLTALYIPTVLEWITVRIGGDTVAHLNGPPAPVLEEMLRQGREMPAACCLPLEDLLFLARHTPDLVHRHRRDTVLTIDGQDYSRWVFCEPYLPQLLYVSVTLEVPFPTIVYAETPRHYTATRDGVFFFTGTMPGVAAVSEGMFCTYISNKSNFQMLPAPCFEQKEVLPDPLFV